MFYGLETLLPSGKSFEILEKQYKKMIKQVLSLPINIADAAIYIISGQKAKFTKEPTFCIDVSVVPAKPLQSGKYQNANYL